MIVRSGERKRDYVDDGRKLVFSTIRVRNKVSSTVQRCRLMWPVYSCRIFLLFATCHAFLFPSHPFSLCFLLSAHSVTLFFFILTVSEGAFFVVLLLFVPYQLGENKNDKWINVEKENQLLSDFFDFIFRGFLFDGLQIPKQLYVWRSFLTQILLRIQNSRRRKNTWRYRASSRTTSPFMIGISRPDCGTRDCFDRYSKSETIKCRSVEDLSVLHFYFLWWLKSLFGLYSLYTCLLSSFPSFVLSFFVLCALIILLFPMIAMHAEPPSWSGRALEWGRALRARWHESSGPLVVAIIAETMTAANNATNIA